MENKSFIDLLARLSKVEAQIQELDTRVHPLQVATVTEIDDDRRMIRVTREVQGAQAQDYFLQAGRRSSCEDEPLPPVGTTVLVGAANGDPHDLHLIRTLCNDTNPPDPTQRSPRDDMTIEIPGDERRTVAGNQVNQTGGDRADEVTGEYSLTAKGQSLTIDALTGGMELTALVGDVVVRGMRSVRLEDGSGSFILLAAGTVTIGNAAGQTWQLGVGTGGGCSWNLNGGKAALTNCTGFTINGKEVIVVGSTDSDNDVNNTRGY